MVASAWGVAAALVLAVVFVVSAVAKLAAPKQWRSQAAGLGVPAPVAAVVPYFEATLGAWLAVQWQRHAAAWAALALLLAFTALLAAKLLQGKRPPCACFGSWSVRPIGPTHLVRNTALLALAFLAALR